jgi:hypothetical protein
MELNPAGLGLYRSSDIAITPGIRVGADQSTYDGSSMNTNHTIFQFAQAGAMLTKKMPDRSHGNGPSNPFALKFITVGINYETENSFDRNQSFALTNTSHSLVDNYARASNAYGTNQWSLESALLSAANIIGTNASGTSYSSNVKAPVEQAGNLNTRGAVNKVNIGFGGNLGDKLFFGLSLGIPILNYSVSALVSETNPNVDSTHFQAYNLSSNISETGVGVTGKLGLIYKPTPWMRFGVAYSLPTWYFLTENYNGSVVYSFDTMAAGNEIDGSVQPASYRIRTPMKGTIGASFYFKEHGFLSVDYDFQNIGSTHYSFPNDSFQNGAAYNSYIKSTYTYSHTIRAGIEGAIKKFRIRAGYSYTTSPFKSGHNYTDASYDQSIQCATFGLGLKFKVFYMDLAYIFSYTRDGVSPGYVIPLDQINSTYMTHSVLLTLGFKIPTKGSSNKPNDTQPKRRSSDQLPKYIDPGDKSY